MSTTNILDLCNRVDELEKKHDSGGTAEDTTYDNTDSGLTADTVQGAIDELAGDIDGLSADDIDYDNTDSGLTADTVQGALDEIIIPTVIKTITADGIKTYSQLLDELYPYIDDNCILKMDTVKYIQRSAGDYFNGAITSGGSLRMYGVRIKASGSYYKHYVFNDNTLVDDSDIVANNGVVLSLLRSNP